jgi:hypothetical protein
MSKVWSILATVNARNINGQFFNISGVGMGLTELLS